MNTLGLAALAVAGITVSVLGILVATVALVFAAGTLLLFWFRGRELRLHRVRENPIIEPNPAHWWESEAVFNPAAFYHNGRVHLLYRALGRDGISRIGYASSADGINFDEHLQSPAYEPSKQSLPDPRVVGRLSYETLTYNTTLNASGGGWGGSEDPRTVIIDDVLYMTFTSFEGWNSERIVLTSLPLDALNDKNFMWSKGIPISPANEVNKNWLLFPEKINGHFAILSSVSPKVQITYIEDPSHLELKPIQSTYNRKGREGFWDNQVRGAGAPPLKTPFGWLLFYHGFDGAHPEVAYKIGAMLLDLNDPSKVLYRSSQPVLEAAEWYENDWKAGVTYASGAVIVGNELFVYYGGGDKRIAAAKINLNKFLKKLMRQENKQ